MGTIRKLKFLTSGELDSINLPLTAVERAGDTLTLVFGTVEHISVHASFELSLSAQESDLLQAAIAHEKERA